MKSFLESSINEPTYKKSINKKSIDQKEEVNLPKVSSPTDKRSIASIQEITTENTTESSPNNDTACNSLGPTDFIFYCY